MQTRITCAVLTILITGGWAAAKDNPAGACALVQKSFEAWSAHDADKVVSFYTDDVVYEDVTFGMVARGSADLRKMVSGFFASVPDMKLEGVSCSADRKGGSVEWIFSGTDTGLYKTGKKFSVRGASRFEMRGGKFSSNKDFYDSATIMRQVGVLPAAPGQ